MIKIRSFLSQHDKKQLKKLLKEYAKIFTWTVDHMPGIPTKLDVHKLNMDLSAKPVKQKKQNFAPKEMKLLIRRWKNF